VQGLKDIFGADYMNYAGEQVNLIKDISGYMGSIIANVEKMINERRIANKIESVEARAEAYCHKVRPYFEEIRYACDKLELLVDDELWPLTKYRELLFTR
jgi:glutamine synthetase